MLLDLKCLLLFSSIIIIIIVIIITIITIISIIHFYKTVLTKIAVSIMLYL